MATAAKRKLAGPAPNGKRRWNNGRDEPQLTILRLDLNTITAQIKILEDELDADPCLSTDGTSTILSLVDALKQELKEIRLRIERLKGSETALNT
jgi:hypothetical protein